MHGAETMIGFAAVQIGLMRGAHVTATAGGTFADQLRAMRAKVTSYGDGMVERVIELAENPVDLVLDAPPTSGVLPALIQIASDDPRRVLTVSDFAADGKFTIPVAQTFTFDEWRTALDISQSGHARGKPILLPSGN